MMSIQLITSGSAAMHVVAKVASNAATVNFIVVTTGESLELVDSGSYIYIKYNKPENKKIHNILMAVPECSMVTHNGARG